MEHKRIINEIKQLLKELKIETGIITSTLYSTKKGMKNKFSFNVYKESYLNFYTKINFLHPENFLREEILALCK